MAIWGSGPAGAVLELRRRLNMTQEEFGRAAGATAITVARWENGHELPGPGHWKAMREMAKQADIDLDWPAVEAAAG